MSEKEQFAAICKKTYEAQAKWYLNGFWDNGAKDQAEEVWKFAHLFISLDPKKKEGFDLDEFLSHKFLEALGETLTVVQLREKLKKIDLDANGRMSLIEYLCFKFTRTAKQIIDAPQAENLKIVEEAQKLLDEVQHAFAEVSQKLQEQSDALEHQRKEEESVRQTAERLKKSEEESRRAEEDARKAAEEVAQKEAEVKKSEEILQAAEDKVRKAEEDLKAAIQALKDQEDARTNTIKNLEAKANDSSLSTVAKAKAANELAQAKESSDFEIRKTKITQEAALRVVEKERKVAEQATNKAKEASDAAAAATSAAKAAASAAENKRKQVEQERMEAEEATKRAEQATRELEVKKKEVEASFAEAEKKVEEAKKFLEEQREKCQSKGSFWWIERDLKEQEKFKPKRAQKS